ncbi:HAMP domain-containing sensor histidine kinase [Paenibacillus chondroitinus]|uniref:histidine kinase n=1 Tax=Paenibacillus chondroitinus TaxID=59842 RepID=A0ABU6DIX8_9BACL|nr:MULTISPECIES: HAMP domain-containing sensor histidine kinase [Paenibacillus]MCY9657724.1 HAMP domain-containing histidine kinase [Paenibacillus anseongense]MEB4797491.1 HAMP domain-containing sensor histidine kinase [Paenibacillus chondroitinus]
MHLTKRFFTMNALAVLLSVGLTVLAVIIFVAAYTKVFGREAETKEFQKAFEVRAAISEIKREAQPLKFEQLLDTKFQQELANRINALDASAIILKNREVVYATQNFNRIDIERSLMLSDNEATRDEVELAGKTYMITRVDYKVPAGDPGVLLLLAPIKLKTNVFMVLGIFTVSVFTVVFLLTNFWVSYRFSRGIISPISRLKAAANKISEGDLSQGIAEEGEGEVRELCRTLELMRIKLKESVYMQQKYDDNRKFLVSSISHDLKTPVTSIKGYIEGIIDGVAKTPEKMDEYLETARSKAILVNAMIDDLLLYSKLDLNQLPYHFEKSDLASYFEDCVADHKYEYEKANLSLSLINELNEPVKVLIDRERLKRVIQNILDNAMTYVEKADGKIEIILRETRTSAIIEIKDNGKGIPENKLPHIFERFYQVDPSRKIGSGLGLAIAKQIIEGHEGKIWAKSAVGEGTQIMISLKKF